MPQGVEHLLSLLSPRSVVVVITYQMPQGVEHTDDQAINQDLSL